VKLLNTRSEHLHVNLRMSGIDVSEVSGCEYDSSFVKGLSRGNGYSFGGEPNSFGQPRLHQARQERLVIPAREGWSPNLREVDFYSLPNDIFCQSLEKRFHRPQLIVLATVPEAPPTTRNQRASSYPESGCIHLWLEFLRISHTKLQLTIRERRAALLVRLMSKDSLLLAVLVLFLELALGLQ
jgi:hypothetical protein